jgi:hypothetical protein
LDEREMLISVIVPARDAAATLGATLASLADQDLDGPYEVIVVDAGSSDDTAAIAERAGNPVRLVRAGDARPGAARNAGVQAATAPLLAFTDADCVPGRGWLRAGVEYLREADLVQGAVVPDPAAERHPFDRTIEFGGPTGLHETANLFVTRAAFEQVGGFDDWSAALVDSHFGEDVVFGWRARRAGARFAFAEHARVAHAVFPRGPTGYVAERRRLELFPALVARVPELRAEFLTGGLFLTTRSARFDLALAGLAVAAKRRSPLPLIAALPYAAAIARRAAPHRRNAALVAATEVAADAVGFGALVIGSLRHRTPVL